MIRPGIAVIAIVLFVLPAASASEAAPLFRSMASVLDMAYEIERYALQRGRYPAAKSPLELSQALLGTDSMADLLVDAWGTPLHIDSEADRYIVASAGADRRFDRELWWTRAATKNAAEDIVIVKGETTRWPEELAMARFRAEGGDEVRALRSALEVSKANRTLADMMAIRMAIEQHLGDHGSMPATVPSHLPQADAWGTPFAVSIDRDAKTYRIVSAGADAKFDEKRWNETGETLDFKRDAVMRSDAPSVKWQTTHAPAQELDAAFAHFTIFKHKHASLSRMSDDERRTLRLEGLDKDMDEAVLRQDYFEAMNLYQEAEKLGVRDTQRLELWALNFSLHTPPPPGQPEPPRLIADARNRAAAGRIAAALRRALADAKDEKERWTLTERLSDLERERGETEVADQLLAQWAAANPRDPNPWLRQLRVAQRDGNTANVLRLAGEIMKIEPEEQEAVYATGLVFYEIVAKSGDTIPLDRKRAFIAHARRMLARAAELDEDAMEPLVYLSLTLRQEAVIEKDAAKSAKLIQEADALRNRALEISKRRRTSG